MKWIFQTSGSFWKKESINCTLYAYKRCMWNRSYHNWSWIFKWIGLSNERVAKWVKYCCAFEVTRRESLIKDFPELQWKENDLSRCQFCNWIVYAFLNIRYLLTVLFWSNHCFCCYYLSRPSRPSRSSRKHTSYLWYIWKRFNIQY